MNKQYFTTATIKVQQFVLAIIILMMLPTHLMAQTPNADLSNLEGYSGTLSPAFNRDSLNYTVTVPNNTFSYTVKPTVLKFSSTIKVNGKSVNSGQTSGFVSLNVGNTVINTVVTSADGTRTKTYKLTVTRLPSSNATLTSLGTSNLTTPYFSQSVYNYTYKASYQTTTLDIQPVKQDITASVTVNGTLITPTQKFVRVNLNMGATATTTIVIKSTAQDGVTVKTYTVVVSHLLSAFNQLKDLTLNPGALNKRFDYDTYEYTTSVPHAASTMDIIPVAKDTLATVTVNGILITTASPSVNVPLRVGNNKIIIKVVAQNGDNHHTYTLMATRRPANTNNKLASLSTDLGAFSPAFNSLVNNYDPLVAGSNITSYHITATTEDALASVKVNGVPALRGVPLAVPLADGNNKMTVEVTAEHGEVNLYKFYVKRAFANNANLSSISLDTKSFLTRVINSDTLVTYTTSVAPGTTTVKLLAVTSDPNATIQVNGVTVSSGTYSGSISLNPTGTTIINTVVTAYNAATKKYRITVSKTGSSNANLISLNLGIPAILTKDANSPTLNRYTTSVDPGISSVTIVPVADDATSTVKVNGVTVVSGSESTPVTLNTSGTTTITTVVTAQDGTTTKTYEIAVAKNGSSDANLANCYVSSGLAATNVQKIIISNELNTYSVQVLTLRSNIQFTPTASDTNAVIRVNGQVVASGHKSPLMAPNYVGTTTFEITVTAPDGTLKRYQFNVSELPSKDATLNLQKLNPNYPLTRTYISSIENRYSATVSAGTSSIYLLVGTTSSKATVRVNGVAIPSSGYSYNVPLNPTGTTTLTTIVTAQDTNYKKKYIIVISKASSLIATTNNTYKTVGIVNEEGTTNTHPDVIVRQAVSPNEDGINDRLTIDGLAAYPDNKVSIIDRTGNVVYELKGYDGSRSFDGRTAAGKRLQQGTYFYSVEYRTDKGLQRKTGYLVLKY